jgi:hypothetical protein
VVRVLDQVGDVHISGRKKSWDKIIIFPYLLITILESLISPSQKIRFALFTDQSMDFSLTIKPESTQQIGRVMGKYKL